MDTIETIRKRRSIREFSEKTPDIDTIMKTIEAARWAPSGLNNQPWKFLIVQDKETKEGLARFTKYKDIVLGAPVSIVVCLDHRSGYNRDKDLMAIGAAIQNILLCACSLGLGTCWLGEIINRKDEVAGYLKLGGGLEIMAVIAMGHPAGESGDGERKPLSELILEQSIEKAGK